ncbi:hypothetical protein QNI19_08400 [Cytophagaceae bacterium DM2B3-1]|uniref:Uncharacterized protein n=1 Tax=Xanthocytophaga flava TaxID=3048013 RepID=A0ABT7CGS5_9BACT|nr:hypothetical protein [Xanthocytophaga flavus]MDJ1492949.1 hypothetical protein [Xanthocytophaga flavus]
MKNIFLLTLTFIVFLFTACNDDDSPVPAAPGVYVVGYENLDDEYHSQAKFWKDGVVSNLTSTADYGTANDVFVSGQDVYVAGSVGSPSPLQPTIWKNGKLTKLGVTNTGIGGSATHIVTSGKDVYAIGFIYDANYGQHATLWKNGEVSLMQEKTNIYFEGLAVSGSDVYVGGTEYVNSKGVATIWKNGVASRIGPVDGTTYTGIHDITIAGADVYVVGVRTQGGSGSEAVVWKNGVVTGVLATGTQQLDLNDIYVSGTDVYVAGFVDDGKHGSGVVWKNGVATELTDPSTHSSASSVCVVGDDVYVGGFISQYYLENGSGRIYRSAKVWKNGVLTNLTNSTYNSEVLSIFVVK